MSPSHARAGISDCTPLSELKGDGAAQFGSLKSSVPISGQLRLAA